MLKQIKLTKLENTHEELEFYSKCSICSVLHINNISSMCNFCTKYFFYVKEDDAIIFHFKNLWLDVAARKSELSYSHHDFLLLENELETVSDTNLAFTYNRKNMAWYIDTSYNQNDRDNFKKMFNTIIDLLTIFFTSSYFNLNILDIEKQKIYEYMEYFQNHRIFGNNSRILIPEFPALTKFAKIKTNMLNCMSRDNIVKNFYDHLPFYESCE